MIGIDMKMPETCGQCRFATAFECSVNRKFIPDFDKKSAHCPLTTLDKQKGEWIFDSEFTEFGNPYGTYRCSVCGGHSSDKYSFCKDCGADMRGSK